MYFPFFQKDHKVHHHVLSAGLFALLFIHLYLGVDALLAGPTVMQKTGKIAALERQTMSYKELAREARKLIISSRKKGKVLKLSEAMNILKNGVATGSGRTIGLMRATASGEIENPITFASAPVTEKSANEIFSARILANKKLKKTPTSSGASIKPSVKTPTTSSSTTSGGSSTTPPSTTSGGGGSSSSASSAPVFSSAPATPPAPVSPAPSSSSTTTSSTSGTSGSSSASSSSTTNQGTTSSSGSSSNSGSVSSSTGTSSSTGSSVSTGSTSSSTGSNSGGSTPQTPPAPPPASNATSMIAIANTENPQLNKLADYQKVVNGFVTNQLMVFLNMPESSANIEGASYYIANTANEFAKFGITPIFIIEPYGDNGQLNLGRIKNGDYTAKLDELFSLLKGARGLTEDKLGILVPYPEINTPAFDRANFVPTDLPILVNQYFDVVRKYYPNARGGLLLDGKSYGIGKTWGEGTYTSYSPYVTGIKSGYISYFGIQGFPWVSNNGADKSYDPKVFLPIALGKESASIVGTSNIWFNTGTMKRSYTSNTVVTTPTERQAMIDGIISQGKSLKNEGYNVFINIFAQDKFSTGEGVDWSYISSASDGVLSADEAVFASFVSQATSSNLNTALFDM